MHQQSNRRTPLFPVGIALMAVVLTAGCQGGFALPSVVPTMTASSPQAASTPTTTAAIPRARQPAALIATPDAALSSAAHDLHGYLVADGDAIEFIQWTESGNALSGMVEGVFPDPNHPDTLMPFNGAVYGTRAGNQVTLTMTFQNPALTLNPMTGVLNGPTLTLYTPDNRGTITPTAFHAATVADYNEAVLALRQRVGQERATPVQSTCTMRFDRAGEDMDSASQWLDYKWYYQVDHNEPGGHRYQIIGPFDTASDARSYGDSRFGHLAAPACVGQLTPDQPLNPKAELYHPRNT